MTLFRKYYKDANNDIKADEAFLNSVIENAHKKRVPSQKNYYRYTLTAAAAVVVISAASISFPLLTDHSDSGVISVVTQTVQPANPTVTNTPTHPTPISTAVPHPPERTDESTLIPPKEKPVKNQAVKTAKQEEKKEKETEKTAETRSKKTEDSADAGTVKPEISETADKKVLFSAPVFGVTADVETADTETADEYGESFIYSSGAVTEDAVQSECTPSSKKHAGGGGSLTAGYSPSYNNADSDDDASFDSVLPSIEAPSGYYLSENVGGKYVFVSAGGGEIIVETYYTGGEDTEPVHNGNSVSFTKAGTQYTITLVNAEQSTAEEIVNSLR